MAEDRDHVSRDTEEDTATGRQRGRRLMRKEEKHAEAEERPIYTETEPVRRLRIVKPQEKPGQEEESGEERPT